MEITTVKTLIKTPVKFIFLEDLSEVDEFYQTVMQLKESNDILQISSNAFEIKSTYGTFIDSFSSTLLVFVGIAFLGINFILGMISLSTFIENKKTTAILTCLGSRNKTIYDLYLSENYLIILISFVVSIFLSIGFQFLLNKIIYQKFALRSLIQIPFLSYFGFRFGLVLFLGLIAVIFSTVFTMTPMLIYRHFSLSDELRDE